MVQLPADGVQSNMSPTPQPIAEDSSDSEDHLPPIPEPAPGSSGVHASAHIITVEDGDDEDYEEIHFHDSEWQDRDIQMVLDSGACAHVMDREEAPGYKVHESQGSRRGKHFQAANGARIENEGEVDLRMEASGEDGSSRGVRTTFQVAAVKRPLMSVGRMCDKGNIVVFTKDGAEVLSAKDGERLLSQQRNPVCRFARSGGLYVADMKLKSPAPFTRQAP